ncbi:MAG: hypothetical protein JSS99_14185 [Actinobacteria bacterium]|nr:hypothetical protein [Actinomycetota bacterium]
MTAVRKGDPDRVDAPDVEIGARVRARALRFRDKPQTHVELRGEVKERGRRREDVETASGSERANLPQEVEPGVTYRDVDVRWRATARLRDRAADV